jgi:hypothetical protein
VIKKDGSSGRKIGILPQTLRVSADQDCRFNQFSGDWAIMRLKARATEVTPFEQFDVREVGSPKIAERSGICLA